MDKVQHSDSRNSAVFRPGLSLQEVAAYYTQWADSYDTDLCKGIYNGPSIAANTVGMLFSYSREDVRILDIACGTGLLGVELYDLGFRMIDGLDPAEGMMKRCLAKGIYDRLICDYIGGDSDLDIPAEGHAFLLETYDDETTAYYDPITVLYTDDTYDCIVISGGMGESHIPLKAFTEMARLVKAGGYVIIAMREEYADCVTGYKNNKLDEALHDLERMGLWKIMMKNVVPNYAFGKDGIVFVLRVNNKTISAVTPAIVSILNFIIGNVNI